MRLKHIKFVDFVTLQRGFDLPESQMKNGEVPVLGSNCTIGYHDVAKVDPPGVVTGRSGTLGLVQHTDVPYWPHNTALWVKDFKGNFPKYVYYKLITLHLENYHGGASVPTLNRNVLRTLPLTITDYDTQVHVAEFLSAYDDLIKNNRRRNELLEQAARLIYQEWFVRCRFPGHEHAKTIDGIPAKWQKASVSDLGEVITGKTPSTKKANYYGGEVPFIKTPDMHASSIVVKTESYLSEEGARTQANKFIPPHSIMVACIGNRLGVVALNAYRAQTNQQINTVVPFYDYIRYFAYFVLCDMKGLLEAYGGGATMPNVNKSKFESMTLIMPDKELLVQFHDLVKPAFKQMQCLSEMNTELEKARYLFLPRLMNGEIAI
jgi:type I restriction enzyme S subunit